MEQQRQRVLCVCGSIWHTSEPAAEGGTAQQQSRHCQLGGTGWAGDARAQSGLRQPERNDANLQLACQAVTTVALLKFSRTDPGSSALRADASETERAKSRSQR